MIAAVQLHSRFGSTGTGCAYDDATLALAQIMVRGYVRGVGCPDTDDDSWPDDLAAVIHLVAHRLHGADFTRTRHSSALVDYSDQYFSPFRGFSLAERAVLDRYRQRLM